RAEVIRDRGGLVTHSVLGRGCDGAAGIPVRDHLARDYHAGREVHLDAECPSTQIRLGAPGRQQQGQSRGDRQSLRRGQLKAIVDRDVAEARRDRRPVVRSLDRQRVAQLVGPTERSEEHTSELQSLAYLVCRLLLEKKKKKKNNHIIAQDSNIQPT